MKDFVEESGIKNWAYVSLEEAVSLLESRFRPLPLVEDLCCILLKCIKEKNSRLTLRVYAHLGQRGLCLHKSLVSPLILALVGIGCMNDAQDIFNGSAKKESCSWSSLITGYVQGGRPDDAMVLYQSHKNAYLHLSDYAFVALLKVCTQLRISVTGQEVHTEITKRGLLENNLFICNSLVHMYARCGLLVEAQAVFNAISVRDAVIWTALIAGYAECGCHREALSCFQKMHQEGFSPDATTFVCSLKACKGTHFIVSGEEIFAEVVRKGLEKEVLIGNVLVNMYINCGMFAEAHTVLDKCSIRSIGCCNVLMKAYAECGHYEESINMYEHMQDDVIPPDSISFSLCLKSCGSVGAEGMGQKVHMDVCRCGLEKDMGVGSALIDMYGKCGSLEEAQEVFNKLDVQDVVSWTALIAGYAQFGHSEKAYRIFKRMLSCNIQPNIITFMNLIAACSHSGLLEDGEFCLHLLCRYYSISPLCEHYICLIDLFGRAGFLRMVKILTLNMPFHPNLTVWHCILAACQRWGNVELGNFAFENAIQLDDEDAAAYILMSNIYSSTGMHQVAREVEAIGFEKLSRHMKRGSSRSIPAAFNK
ncbi:hypothetical protein KP509_07G044100 [Ceratopteris richardii]|nr:hypothetical protein KP509_07G044100 [Ceratopteris richardii]